MLIFEFCKMSSSETNKFNIVQENTLGLILEKKLEFYLEKHNNLSQNISILNEVVKERQELQAPYSIALEYHTKSGNVGIAVNYVIKIYENDVSIDTFRQEIETKQEDIEYLELRILVLAELLGIKSTQMSFEAKLYISEIQSFLSNMIRTTIDESERNINNLENVYTGYDKPIEASADIFVLFIKPYLDEIVRLLSCFQNYKGEQIKNLNMLSIFFEIIGGSFECIDVYTKQNLLQDIRENRLFGSRAPLPHLFEAITKNKSEKNIIVLVVEIPEMIRKNKKILIRIPVAFSTYNI